MLAFPLSLLSCFSMCHIKLVAGFAKPKMWLISLVSAFAVWRFYFSLKLWYLGTPHLYHWYLGTPHLYHWYLGTPHLYHWYLGTPHLYHWYLGTPHLYHWRELPQISFFCHNKHVFVFCCDKSLLVVIKHLSCVVTSILLS